VTVIHDHIPHHRLVFNSEAAEEKEEVNHTHIHTHAHMHTHTYIHTHTCTRSSAHPQSNRYFFRKMQYICISPVKKSVKLSSVKEGSITLSFLCE
jgi:hypothetical protein